jgi:GNAT superfamily N-acetyltransferase
VVAAVVEVTGREGFRPQDVEIFRPYSDEIPWELLTIGEQDEDRLLEDSDVDFMRVAKYEGQTIGAYLIQPAFPTLYVLRNLTVDPAWRGCGLGRWLLGHAIGISESKGAREILIRAAPRSARALFERTGFRAEGDDLRLVLMPE